MTHINFYRISGGFDNALKLVCQLVEKARQQKLSVLIHAEADTNDKLSEMLWSSSPSAFLPHAVEAIPTSNISLTSSDDPGEHHGLLISLKEKMPNWFSRFEKAVEIVYDDQQVIAQKRDNFGHHKSRGYPLQYHDLQKPDHKKQSAKK